MNFKHFKQITGVLAVLVASGCASTGSGLPAPDAGESIAVGGIGTATLGDVISVPVEAGLGSTSVVVASEYMAASGRLCRRMQTPAGQAVSRVACKNDNAQWVMARDLVPNSTRLMSSGAMIQPQMSGAQATIVDESTVVNDNVYEAADVVAIESAGVVVEEMAVDGLSVSDINAIDSDISMQPTGQLAAVEYVVLANETLWSFAKRTTGNALNWQRIALINDIDDARTVSDGDVLRVPAELEKSGS